MSKRIDHDQLFKELLSTFFVEFLELFTPQVLKYLEPASIEFMPQEVVNDLIEGSKRSVDMVVKAKFKGKDACFLINVEAQSSDKADFDYRLFNYFARLHAKYRIPVYPIALFTYDKPKQPRVNGYQITFPDWQVLDFNYRAIQLNQLNWRDYLNHQNPLASALMAKMQMESKERAKVKAECLRLLVTLKLDPARMHLIGTFIDTYLDLNNNEEIAYKERLQEFDIEERNQVLELTTSWEEKGRAEGHLEGLHEGRQKGRLEGQLTGQQTLIVQLLNQRLGAIGSDIEAHISNLSAKEIEQLGANFFNFNTVDDLKSWLVKDTEAWISKSTMH